MAILRKIKNTLCCYSNKHILLDDDDDDVASILEQHIRNSSYNNNRNNNYESDNNIYNTGTNTRSNNNRKKSYSNQQEVSEKFDDEESNSNTRLQQQQIIVKSVLRKRRNASVSTIKSDHSPRRRYNVLLFGDSLTAGWMKNSEGYASYYPYGLRLQKRFEEEGLDVEVTVSGVPGECVVSMEERLKNELEQPGKWYDWVVILGGTNDVINGYSAWEIFDGLKKLYTLCSKHGARVLGITIPEFDWDIVNHLDYQRRIVNEHLNVYNNSTTRNAFTLFLLDRFFPMHSLTTEQRRIFWDHDGVHPTQEGYDLMGDMMFDILFKEGTWD